MQSGLHPFGQNTGGPGVDVVIPNQFFLNSNLIAGGTPGGFRGLGIQQATSFGAVARVTSSEYAKLINDTRMKVGTRPGDAHFAWLVPEAGNIDVDMVDQLLKRGVVTPQFAAAVLAIDLENPILSADRKALKQFVPKSIKFRPLQTAGVNAHPDDTTKRVIAALEAANPAAGSPQAQWLSNLKDPDPVKLLRDKVIAYRTRVEAALKSPGTRSVELARLFNLAIQRRKAIAGDPVQRALIESQSLFPAP